MLIPDLLDVSLNAFDLFDFLDELFLFSLEHRYHIEADLDFVFFGQPKTVKFRLILFQLFQRW